METITTQLRPRTLGELLDQAFRFYRRHFLTLIAITATTYVPGNIMIMLLTNFVSAQQSSVYTYDDIGKQLLSLGLSFLAMLLTGFISLILIQGIAGAAVTRAIADDYLGLPCTFAGAYGRIKGRLGKLIGALLLAWVFSMLLAFWWLVVPCVGWVSGLGMVVFFQAAVWPLLAAVVLFENQRGSGSYVRRAWDLVRHRFWWVVGFTSVLALFNLIISFGPTMVVSFILGIAGIEYMFESPLLTLVIQSVLQSLVSITTGLLYYPLQLTAMTLLYFDLRVRYESFDLNYMATQAYDEDVSPEAVLAEAPAPTGSLITGHEFGGFILLSLAYYVLFVAAIGIFGTLFSLLLFQGGNW